MLCINLHYYIGHIISITYIVLVVGLTYVVDTVPGKNCTVANIISVELRTPNILLVQVITLALIYI